MKDIKEKVRDKNPKIRNPASRLPKELVRSAMLETKEKSRMAADKVGRETGEESPVEYAGNRIERAEQRAAVLGLLPPGGIGHHGSSAGQPHPAAGIRGAACLICHIHQILSAIL